MKRTVKYIAVSLLLLSGAIALAQKPVQTWNSPAEAAKHDKNISRNLNAYLREGYVLVEEVENAYRYLVPPEGDHLWGECVFRLKYEVEGPSLEVVYVTMTAFVDYKWDDEGYVCSGFEILEQAVY